MFKNTFNIVFEHGLMKIAELITDKLTTKQLCIDGTCVNSTQLQSLLNQNNITPPTPIPSPTPSTDLGPASSPQASPTPTSSESPIPTPTDATPSPSASVEPSATPDLTSTPAP